MVEADVEVDQQLRHPLQAGFVPKQGNFHKVHPTGFSVDLPEDVFPIHGHIHQIAPSSFFAYHFNNLVVFPQL